MKDYNLLHHIGLTTNGEKIWYIAEFLGYVMEIDIETSICRCVCDIPSHTVEDAYRMLIYHEDKLYLLPNQSGIIYVYDLKEKNFNTIVIKKNEKCFITGGVARDGYIYMYGNTEYIYKYNVSNGDLETLHLDRKKIGIGGSTSSWFWTESFIYNKNIYILMNGSNGILKLDNKDEPTYISFGKEHEGWKIRNIVGKDNLLHVLYADETLVPVYAISDFNGKIIESKKVEFDDDWDIYPFIYATYENDRWIIFPYRTNKLSYIDRLSKKNTSFFECSSREKDIRETKGCLFSSGINLFDGRICAVDQMFGHLVVVDTVAFKAEEKEIKFSKESKSDFIKMNQLRMIEKNSIVYEQREFADLACLIDGVLNA